MNRIRWIMLVLATSLVAFWSPVSQLSSAHADTTGTINVNGKVVVTSDINLASNLAVETLLLRVKTAQGSTSPAWENDPSVTSDIKTAVARTITRPDLTPQVSTTTVYVIGSWRTTSRSAFEARLTTMSVAYSTYVCGWAFKRVQYKPGVIVYYWMSLQTRACANGTRLQYKPAQSVNGDGSWGWQYKGCVDCYVNWWPYPTKAVSYAEGKMEIGKWPFKHDRWPWIKHIMSGDGTVVTSSHD